MVLPSRSVLIHLLAFIFALVLGIGRNLPYPELYPIGIAPAEMLLVILILVTVCSGRAKVNSTIMKLLWLVVALGTICLFSIIINSFQYGFSANEIFEVFRYILLSTIPVIMKSFFQGTQRALIDGFSVGILVSVFFAILNPMNPDILGIIQIYNPNVIGYLLAYGAWLPLIGYLVFGRKRYIGYLLFMLAITILTFSKGAWLCVLLLAIALIFLVVSSLNTIRFVSLLPLLLAVVFVDLNYLGMIEKYTEIIMWKVRVTDFEASAIEGGSFSARVGLALSGILITLENPLVGVGLSNFESAHENMISRLGSYYYEDDNPNNVFLYLSSGAGVFALSVWLSILAIYLYLASVFFSKLRRVSISSRRVAVFCFATATVVGGLTQNEMLNAFYFWFYFGLLVLLIEGFENGKENSANRSGTVQCR